jgi:hypothetical protein
MNASSIVQLPLPSLDHVAYPRAADGLVHQCAWCRRVLDRSGRFTIPAETLRENVSHGICYKCATLLE